MCSLRCCLDHRRKDILVKKDIIAAAYAALEHAYAPYSQFRVGACVVTKDNRLFVGTNVENVSYGLSCCAERNALFAGISAGVKKGEFCMLAVVSEKKQAPAPCGACRQVMCELMDPNAQIIMVGAEEEHSMTVRDLLPFAFDEEDMQ